MSPKRETVEKYPFLVRYTESKLYYLRTSISGRLVERSTGTDSLSKALTIAKRLMAEAGGNPALIGKITYNDLRDEVLLAQSNKAPATYASAKFQYAKLDRFLINLDASKLTDDTWNRYVAYSREQEPKRQLEHDRRHYLMVAGLAYKRGLLAHPVRIKKLVNEKGSPGRALADEEIKTLLIKSKITSLELYVQVVMALTMGLRLSEILKLTWDRVDFERLLVVLRPIDTKIRRARVVNLDPDAARLLQTLPKPKPGLYVFPHRNDPTRPQTSLKTLWTEVRRLSSVKCRFHDLRHTFLTRKFKESLNPALICTMAGLSLEEAQKTYLHITPDDTRVVISQKPWGNLGIEI